MIGNVIFSLKFFLKICSIIFLVYVFILNPSQAGVIAYHHRWEKYPIRVCFGLNLELSHICQTQYFKDHLISQLSLKRPSPDFRLKIINFINHQFNPSKTNIRFSGWKNCSELEPHEYDLVLLFNENSSMDGKMSGEAPIGPCSLNPELKNYVLITTPSMHSFSFITKMTLLHELGHSLGLYHEDELEMNILNQNLTRVTAFNAVSVMHPGWLGRLNSLGQDFISHQSILPQTQDPTAFSQTLLPTLDKSWYWISVFPKLTQGDIQTLKILYP